MNAPFEQPVLDRPHGLWSLWDMIRFDAALFVSVSREIGRLTTVLKSAPGENFRTEENRKNDTVFFEYWKGVFDSLGLAMCSAQAQRGADECKNNKFLQHRDMVLLMHELGNRMEDECAAQHFIRLYEEESKYFEPKSPLFGDEIENKLASISYDISESGKCLGLRRPTASVFHLMRIMETGVQKFGDLLGIQLANEKVWQVILDQINAEIRKLGKTDDAKTFASISSNLYNVKLAWRNEAMHPNATYTPEDAEAIFVAVRNFMRELCSIL